MASRNTSSAAATDARARARQMQVDQQRKDRRRRSTVIWGSVIAAVLVVALVVAFLATRGNGEVAASGPMPAVANEEGGVTLTSTTQIADAGAGQRDVDASKVEVTQPASDQPESIPAAGAPAEGEPAHIVLYVDFNCVHCFEFESANADKIKEWVDAGKATVEYRVVNFLSTPANQNYSARSAAAAYCVAATKPEAYWDFATGLFTAYGQHQGKGLSDDELTQRAADAGVDIASCVDDDTYRPAVEYTTAKAKAAGVVGTPTVFVNGKNWAIDGADQTFHDWAGGMIDG